MSPYDREEYRSRKKSCKNKKKSKDGERGMKRESWWIGCRGNGYVGLYCSEGSTEDISHRRDSAIEVLNVSLKNILTRLFMYDFVLPCFALCCSSSEGKSTHAW